MNRVRLGARVLPFLAFAFLATLATAQSSISTRPNIVFILADDMSWSDLGCYGHPWHRTPNLDGLANDGMRLTEAYAAAPICSASRASILTGKTPARLGFEFVTKEQPGRQRLDSLVPLVPPALTLNLPLHELTVGECLTSVDYQTAFFGKWHVSRHHGRYLGWSPEFGPHQQGFQVAVEDFGDHPYAWKDQPANAHLVAPEEEFIDDTMVQRVADFISGTHDGPYFVMASSFYVHTPIKNRSRWLVNFYDQAIPPNIANRAKRVQYAAFMETFDHHVGQILDAVNRSDQADNTLVVFTSDNGGHPEFTANGPLRGSKWNLYEGGIRVPMIVRWSGRVAAGSVSDVPVIGYDLMPTFAAIAGGEPGTVDGVNLLPVLGGANLPLTRDLIWHFPYYHPETSFDQAKANIGTDDFVISQTRPQSALLQGEFKAIWFAEDDRIEVYRLDDEAPSETVDLAPQQPKLAARLKHAMLKQLQSMNARYAVPATRHDHDFLSP